MAEHYGSAIIPARPVKPKDKPNAEGTVRVIETGFKDGLNGEGFRSPRKNAKKKTIGKDFAELSSYTNNHLDKSCSHTSDATRRVRSVAGTC